jgi:deoxycytidine triphosphate deaminase
MSMKNIASDTSTSSLTDIQEGDVQPNAVDLRLNKVFEVIHDNEFLIDDHKKVHRGTQEIYPDEDGYFIIEGGETYEVVMENIVQVGDGEAGWVITRSTLNRNGLYLTSGLYDTGYHGVMAGMLHNRSGDARIAKGTRIGQYLTFSAEALYEYSGDYGIGKTHDDKYK